MSDAIIVALISCVGSGGVMGLLLAVLQRKWKKADEKQIDPALIAALVAAQKVTMVDRIRYLGGKYIQTGEISLEEKETLHEMHAAYKALGGNGHLDTVMGEVDKLQVVERRYSA